MRGRFGHRPELVLNNGGRGEGPPDLDELWRDFNRKLSNLFGGKQRANSPGNGGPNFQPDMRGTGIGISLVAGLVVLVWAASGFFIVQEGQQAVVTSFGKYSHTVDAGFNWRFPYPFQANEVVAVTQLRSVEVGRSAVVQATGLRESSMLTKDENIVDIRFTVQYRLKDARAYLFENAKPDEAVIQAAESAVREIVGKSNMDQVLYEQRDEISSQLMALLQAQLDRLNTGILVVNVNVGSVQAPEQVQAAFDDAFRAGADREKAKNEGQAYANDVIPKARGSAARLHEEAEAYKARVVARAEGDAQRFSRVLAEYQKAPSVTRDRIYIDTMRDIYAGVSKVMADGRNNSNLLYLPLDKLIQQSAAPSPTQPATPSPVDTGTSTSAPGSAADVRLRDGQRSRDRDAR
ncbi:FtsH protease activity modulator HflK [Piscinibacter gummiphilus]|uniref:Protein HflK n=1 Tax=Piscinibacter gummiphilus TaxID=946333 RepID=A0ABZ0D6N2_9BURK|nr:FtsH protease activity modulator HflK [Piscinibacter gummiphilus]WOB11025.1 FtsH protease activity modulator HflK [Piscinibacter gummiphilus]